MANQRKISVPVFTTKRGDCWVAYCPVLKLYGYSEKKEEDALKDFDDAIDSFFHVQDALGTLRKTLLSLGWEISKKAEAPVKKYNSNVSPFRNGGHHQQRQISVPAF